MTGPTFAVASYGAALAGFVAILMSMGMMMVPPAIVSLPFKLAFFVIADGWTLIADSLVRGYM
ncbi:Flagellar biosynthetic protein FliP precursor [Roseovarius tolerans]|jgi:flagellar biosynthesis protein FliP|uniref:Flagellar biosynthetic protein FliP n=1 Tax=Roseovarius tolerans TaxID=74031 RepID=A0A0L6CTT8_9RHOB|nr:Flagellar biosynthetic protein FliP precursor [Roseovarius tolerans]